MVCIWEMAGMAIRWGTEELVQGSVSGLSAWLCTLWLSMGTELVARAAAGAMWVGVPKDGLQLRENRMETLHSEIVVGSMSMSQY